jgi:hypothetical protein
MVEKFAKNRVIENANPGSVIETQQWDASAVPHEKPGHREN